MGYQPTTRHKFSPRAAGVAAGAAVIAAATAITPASSAPSSAGSAACTPVYFLAVPGTSETSPTANPDQPVGLLTAVSDPLKQRLGDRVAVKFLPYSASVLNRGLSYVASRATGETALSDTMTDIAKRCPSTRFLLVGYSQGADAVGNIATQIGNGGGPVPADRVLGVATISDPHRGAAGEMLIGPPVSGTGILGPRKDPGALKSRWVTFCRAEPADRYCARGEGPGSDVLAGLASVIGGTGTGESQASSLAGSLVSDFTGANLAGVDGAVRSLNQQLGDPSGQYDTRTVTNAASSLLNTLRPVADTIHNLTGNTAMQDLLNDAAPGSPRALADQAVTALQGANLSGAIDTVSRILTTAQSAGGTKAPTGEMSGAAHSLASELQPVTTQPADALTAATSVLSTIKPDTLISQVVNVGSGAVSFALNVPRIIDLLIQLPQRVFAGDLLGARDLTRELNTLFGPLVKMAAKVDLNWISTILAVIPDTSGTAQIASVICRILAGVDVIRIANNLGQIQESAWDAVLKLLPPEGKPADPVGALAAGAGALPSLLDLASTALAALTGGGTKLDPSQLGKAGTKPDASLASLSTQLTQIAGSQGVQDLTKLVSAGADAASFYGSGAHVRYADYVVDAHGRTAPQWAAEWMAMQANQAG